MSSACTPQRLICNITSCFFARRLRLEEKPDAFIGKPPEMSSGSIVFDFTGGGGRVNKSVGGKSMASHSNRSEAAEPHIDIEEEEYLVFCFGEDGAIDIINEEDDETRATAALPPLHKGEEKVREDDEIKEMKNLEVEEHKNRSLMEHFEASDSISNLSDSSSASFAFPILKMEEWMGSPVHMPKHENRLQCCRF